MTVGFFRKQGLTYLFLTPHEGIEHKVGEDHRGDTEDGQYENEKLSVRGPMVQVDVLKEVI
jgi:hypothetical protein